MTDQTVTTENVFNSTALNEINQPMVDSAIETFEKATGLKIQDIDDCIYLNLDEDVKTLYNSIAVLIGRARKYLDNIYSSLDEHEFLEGMFVGQDTLYDLALAKAEVDLEIYIQTVIEDMERIQSNNGLTAECNDMMKGGDNHD